MKYLLFFIIINIMIIIPLSSVFSEETHMHHHEAMRHGDIELSGIVQDGVRVVKIKAFRYGFEPDPIVVRLDEKVRLELMSIDVAHGLSIQDFGINLVASAGRTNSVEFTADKIGNFHIHCSVYCGPGHSRMHGALVVIE